MYKGYSPTDFERSFQTTLAKHISEVEMNALKNFKMGALIESGGRVLYNQGGRGLDWPVQYRLHAAETYNGEAQRSFARQNLWKQANLEYRGYEVRDGMYTREFLENRGPEGIIKVFGGMVDRLTTSLRQHLGTQYYVNGYHADHIGSYHGFESLFQTDGKTVNVSTGVPRSANAADLVAYPEGTYAGLDMTPGAYGGDQETGVVWPAGVSSPEYDFWTPTIVLTDSTAFSASTHNFRNQGDEAIRFALIHSQRNTLPGGSPTQVFLNRSLYADFKNLQSVKEQIQVQRGSGGSLVSLGFGDVIMFDGVEVTFENAIPANVGYGFNINMVELLSMREKLLHTEGPEYDIYTDSFNALVNTLSNLKFRNGPRGMFKLAPSTAI